MVPRRGVWCERYPLTTRSRDLASAGTFLFPLLVPAAVVLIRGSDRAKAETAAASLVLALIVTIGTLGVGALLLHRRWIHRSEIEVGPHGVTLFTSGRAAWTIAWDEMRSVTLRRYTVRSSYFSEALFFRTKDGERRHVPTLSAIYGEIPNRLRLVAHLDLEGPLPIDREPWPHWIDPV